MISPHRQIAGNTIRFVAAPKSRRIKILHIIGLAHGGAGQHILSLATGCDLRRFESVVAMSNGSPMRPQFEQAGVRVLPLMLDHYGGLRNNVVAFKQLVDILRRERFDVIQTHTSVAGALGRIAARLFGRAPVVHMLHTFAAHPYRSTLLRMVGTLIERRLDRWTDWYIAGSQAMVSRGVSDRIFAADKVVLISNGIDLASFERDLDCPRSANRFPQVVVGFSGRLEKQKGVAYLIHAASIVRKSNPHVRFLIAGDGTLRQELESLATRLEVDDVVEFIGWTSDIPNFLRQIDILAMPSLWEAFGLSAAEAMASGKPVIASRIQGLPEVVEDGSTGILVPPADPETLAGAIITLAADPARQQAMGQRGRARVEQRFTVDRMVSHHEEFYERLAGQRHTRRFATRRLTETADITTYLSD